MPVRPGSPAEHVQTTLFRALAVLRAVVLGYALWKNASRWDDFAHPGRAWAATAVLVGWTAVATWAYDQPSRRRLPLYAADLAVAIGLVLSTRSILSQAQLDGNASHFPTFWVMAPVLAWTVGRGWLLGLAAAIAVSVADISVKVAVTGTTLGNIFLLLLGAGMVGYTSARLETAAEVQAAAERAAAAYDERTRLSRAVHDGVLQVLALVQRRGLEAGGDLAEIGRLAGEQEVALRALVQGDARVVAGDPAWRADLVAALEAFASPTVTVSGPGHAVELSAHSVDELVAVVAECLANVVRHVGANAPAWVLVEDLGSSVVVTVRDGGPGIPAGRLDVAATEGRLGVSESIRGRVRDLGGRADVVSGSDGTEWELTVPRGASG